MNCFYPVSTPSGLRPCGQCAACMLNKHLSWRFRLQYEVLKSDCAYWCTLQYDDDHLPVLDGVPVVNKLHCQNFFRKLRKSFLEKDLKVTFKYFLVSELGPTTLRPHYHVLLLFRLPSLPVNKLLELRQQIYEEIKERWYHGHCEESLFHTGVIKYLTKYVFKPYKDFSPPVPMFRLISKGIGEEYLKEIDLADAISNDWRMPNGILPRYYRDKILPTQIAHFPILENKMIRSGIFNRHQDKVEKQIKIDLNDLNGSIDAYIKRQKYLTACQMRAVERKQKEKYG